MNNVISDFFEPIDEIKYIGSDNYRKVERYTEALQSISNLCDLSYYIIDYYKKSFYYVSQNPLFLSGYTQKKVLELGYDFYQHCVPPEDLELLFDLNIAGFKFFYELPRSRREKGYISYDFRLKHKTNNSLIMITHKLAPLLFTEDGNIWMAICLVTLSTRKEPGDVHFFMHDENKRYNFNREKKSFDVAKNTKLTKRETEILKCIAIGDRTEVISRKLNISESTVKNHKTKILKKLSARTSAEAVFCASQQKLI
jgi:DNA-binding CsgD family transcriptional regulator/PAS domain-containing protein